MPINNDRSTRERSKKKKKYIKIKIKKKERHTHTHARTNEKGTKKRRDGNRKKGGEGRQRKEIVSRGGGCDTA